MTVATVRSTVQTAVAAVSGVENVAIEEPYGLNPDDAIAARSEAGKVHFWLVRATTIESGGGAGYLEPRRQIRVEGYLEDDPEGADGVSSYVRAANLQSSVEAALAAKTLTVDAESVIPDAEIPQVDIQVGEQVVRCHRIGLTAVIVEVT